MQKTVLALILLCACWSNTQAQVAPAVDSIAPKPMLENIRAYLAINDQLSTSGQITYDEIAVLKDAGFEVVINLAPADEERNGSEGFLVTQQGMTYIQIPVSWKNPAPRDLKLFFDVMEANKDRKVYVHCFANMRVSAFVYLYRTLQLGEPEAAARADMEKIWDPNAQDQWVRFIEQAREAPASGS
ncbi:MAG: protein tyrosine phosphatase family protein [Bacteroidota bacterium]